MKIKENVSLKPYTVFQVGGPARFFVEVDSREELKSTVEWAFHKKLPFFILGLGSNILVSDDGFRGLVIKPQFSRISQDGEYLLAEAGAKMAEVVDFALKHGLTGFEWAIGVPGTVGGSVRGNAGWGPGLEMRDVIEQVLVLDGHSGDFKTFSNADCLFSYRESIFKKHPEFIITAALLKLKIGNIKEARERLQKFSRSRLVETKQASGRIGSQEIGKSTAGSTFKNVRFPEEKKNEILKRFPAFREAFEKFPNKEVLSAGFLIDMAELKGTKVGGAMVSNKHANFIINAGDARAEDIVILIGHIKEKIHRLFDVLLEEEIQYVGFD